MKLEQIKELMQALADSNLHELIYRSGEERILLRKSPAPIVKASEPQVVEAPRSLVVEKPQLVEKEEPSKNTEAEETNISYVESPLVGTFYRSSGPEAEPYVSVGSKVKKGDPLCIIEAMKIMNIIEAEVDGVIKEVYIENSHFVEYKSKMFKIQTT